MPVAHIREIITIEDDAATHDWSSTQVNIPDDIAKSILEFADSIKGKQDIEEGQDEPHITVLYGIDDSDPARVKTALKGTGPVRLKLGKLSLFENDDADVLKLDVESTDLPTMNRKLREEVPHVEKQPQYTPHCTVAYLNPGDGENYVGKPIPGVTGKRMILDTVMFSSKDGKSTAIKLAK